MSVPDKVLMRKIKKRESKKLKVLQQRETQKSNGELFTNDERIVC